MTESKVDQVFPKEITIVELKDGIEMAWGLIANAGNGNWQTQTQEWQEAAAKWRDKYLPLCIRS